MKELRALWQRMIGTPPDDIQWELWATAHSPETIKYGILATVRKNLSLGKQMTEDHRVRFASKVMLEKDRRDAEHVANREKIAREFGGEQ